MAIARTDSLRVKTSSVQFNLKLVDNIGERIFARWEISDDYRLNLRKVIRFVQKFVR